MNSERFKDLKLQVGHFEARRMRAATRLESSEGKYWYFAILGLSTDSDLLKLAPIAQLRRVTEPPGEVELAAALENKSLFSAIGRYSHGIQYELAVNLDELNNDQAAFNYAWWIISALRVRTLSELLIPAVANYSWSTIAAITDGRCHAQLVEDVPLARAFGPPVTIQEDHWKWVEAHLVEFVKLLEIPKFRLAVEALSTHHFSQSERMMAATLWAGIEALFEIQSELRFRIAVVIACLLEPRGNERKKLYQSVKKLYDTRSKAVHGSPLAKAKIEDHILQVRLLLSRLLCHFVEIGSIPTENQIEDYIFG